MPEAIRVQLARTVEGRDLLESLAARGLAGRLVEEEGGLAVLVSDGGGDAERLRREVLHALDAWVGESGLPLVPTSLGDEGCALRPPAA